MLRPPEPSFCQDHEGRAINILSFQHCNGISDHYEQGVGRLGGWDNPPRTASRRVDIKKKIRAGMQKLTQS